MTDNETEFTDPEAEERIINTSKIYEFIAFYKIPLVFTLVAVFLLGGTVLLWQLNKESARVVFTQEKAETVGQKIKVDIEGAVVSPGVYEVASGSRIKDLLIIAGGLAVNADREWVSKNLNQAVKLTDGGKVYIPAVGETRLRQDFGGQNAPAGLSTGGLVNINIAGQSELDSLPGIGPVTAQKIIDARPYQTIEELVSRKIIGKSIFEKIKDKISTY